MKNTLILLTAMVGILTSCTTPDLTPCLAPGLDPETRLTCVGFQYAKSAVVDAIETRQATK